MRDLRQVHHKHLVGDGFSQGYREFHLRLCELLRVQYAPHRDDVCVLVRHLNTYCPLSWHRRDDTYALCCKAQRNVVLQVLNLRDADARCRRNLIERDGRAHRSPDGAYLHVEIVEDLDNLVFLHLKLVVAYERRHVV